MWVNMPLHPQTELRFAGKQLRAKGICGEKRASGTSPEALNSENANRLDVPKSGPNPVSDQKS